MGKQKRDKRGRFAGGGGFAESRLAAFGKHLAGKAAVAAGAAGGVYLASKALGAVAGKAPDVGDAVAAKAPEATSAKAPEPTKAKSTQPHNRSISLGQGVRIKGQQVSTLERAADIAKANTRSHGITAHTADSLRTMKSLEKLALVERRAHPEGTAEHATKRPHYVATRQGVDALVKAGIWSAGDREKWTRARKD